MLKHLFNIILFSVSSCIIYSDLFGGIREAGVEKNLILLLVFTLASVLIAGLAGYLKRTKEVGNIFPFNVLGNKFLFFMSSLLIGFITVIMVILELIGTKLIYHPWVMFFTVGIAPMLVVILLLLLAYRLMAKEQV